MVSSSDEDEDNAVLVNEAGRIVYGGRMEFPPWSFRDVLQVEPHVIEKLRNDAMRICRTEAMDYGEGDRSRGETFFIGANEKPRCALEQMAQEIFFFHARGAVHYSSLSGAEWWCVVMDDPDTDEVSWHWDKDNSIQDEGIHLYPHIASVTYLCDVGPPTCIVMDARGQLQSSRTESTECSIKPGIFVSYPEFGKHTSFE